MLNYQENFRPVGENRYKVAFSYRNFDQQGVYAKELFDLLSQQLDRDEIFFDQSEASLSEVLGVNRDLEFLNNYYKADVIFVLYSNEYQANPNCLKELEIARELINNPHLGRRRVILVRFDDAPFPEEYKELNKTIFAKKDLISIPELAKAIIGIVSNQKSDTTKTTLPSSYNFEVQPAAFYGEMLGDLKVLLDGKYEESKLSFPRVGFERKLDQLMKQFNLVFIEGPFMTGKTTLLRQFESKYKEEYQFLIPNSENFVAQKDRIEKLEDLFFQWTKQIIWKATALQGKEPRVDIQDLTDPETFKQRLSAHLLSTYPKSRIHAFITLLGEIKTYFFGNQNINLALAFENLEQYASTEVFSSLREEAVHYHINRRKFEPLSKGVKLIFVTRYFPFQRPVGAVLPVEDFHESDIVSLFKPLFEKEAPEIEEKIYAYIHEVTHGHPWFSFRLLRTYLTKRTRGDKQDPASLIQELIYEPDYWFKDNYFEDMEGFESLYTTQLVKLIHDNEPYREFFLRFISLNGDNANGQGSVRINNKDFTNNPILRQAGFIRLKDSHSVYNDNMNKILRLHLKKEIERFL